jgi:hypothetical protein
VQDEHFQVAVLEQAGEPAFPAAAVVAVMVLVVFMVRGAGEAAFAVVIVMFVFVVFQAMSSPYVRHNLDISKYSLSQVDHAA